MPRAVLSATNRAVTNEDIATFVVEFANGAAGTFSISRVALGHPNDLGFEVFGTKARHDSTCREMLSSGTSTTRPRLPPMAGAG